ncbi:class I SAM-dependent methyltransferase [Gracilibacillus xinjiangensis]|uniref:Class I SAM-dependent methyltransferase n=1 Tax=Gracilibacillus xinjiangensis TaxID=1193282 RepID=A0ABV8X0W0_9BACI
MNELDFYNKIGKKIGWNFNQLQVTAEGQKWDFYEEVKKHCKKTDILLDIGTGSGENLIKLAEDFHLLVGIDQSPSMIEKASESAVNAGVNNVRFFNMAAEHLKFPAQFFHCIISRHAPFDMEEVARMLADDGIFLTQQVSEADKLNVKETFGIAQNVEENDGKLKQRYVAELEKAGFTEIHAYDYNATEYYQRAEDLLFLLEHAPIIPNFGKNETDDKNFNTFIHRYQTDKGIRTNEKRFLIIARK